MRTLNPLKVNAFHKDILIVKPYKNQDLHIPAKNIELLDTRLNKELSLAKNKDCFIISQKEVNMKSHYGMFCLHHLGNITLNYKETNKPCEIIYYLNTNNNSMFFEDTVVVLDEPKPYKEINIKLKTNQILHVVTNRATIDNLNQYNMKELHYILNKSLSKDCVGAESIFYFRKYFTEKSEENHLWLVSANNTQRSSNPVKIRLTNYTINLYYDTVEELAYEKFDENTKRYVMNYNVLKSDIIINKNTEKTSTAVTQVKTNNSYVYQSPTVIVKKVSKPEIADVKISFVQENSLFMTENVFYKDYLKKATRWIGWGAEG